MNHDPDKEPLPAARQGNRFQAKPEARAAFLEALAKGSTVESAALKLNVPRSTAYYWQRLFKRSLVAKRLASVRELGAGNLEPRDLLQKLANDLSVLPGYRVQAASALLRLDAANAKPEADIPVSVLAWIDSLIVSR